MGTKAVALPKGGETIYEIIRVRAWLIQRFPIVAKAVSNIFFTERLKESERKVYDAHLAGQIGQVNAFIDGRLFASTQFASQHMAYGRWVDNELYPALFNRLSVVVLHPVWPNLDLQDRVRLVVEVIFGSMIRCALGRACAWKGDACEGEPPFMFTDRWKGRHAIDLSHIPTAIRFGPEPPSDDG